MSEHGRQYLYVFENVHSTEIQAEIKARVSVQENISIKDTQFYSDTKM